jgi:hypothetical protein
MKQFWYIISVKGNVSPGEVGMKFAIGDPVLVYNLEPTLTYFKKAGNLRLVNILIRMTCARGEVVSVKDDFCMVLLSRRPTEALPFHQDSLRLNRWNIRFPIHSSTHFTAN